LQAKLRIGQPGDVYEQEADRVADTVMRMPEPGVQRQVEPEEEEEETLQPKPLASQITPLVQVQRQEEPEEEEEETFNAKPLAEEITPLVQRQVEPEEEEEEIQPKSLDGAAPEVTPEMGRDIQSIKGKGQPLSASERAFFEPRFGADFGDVRVHSDARAAHVAQSVNARAFTLGQDVVFGAAQYAPESSTGQRLMAHELTHVVQQIGANKRDSSSLIQKNPGPPKIVLPTDIIKLISSVKSSKKVFPSCVRFVLPPSKWCKARSILIDRKVLPLGTIAGNKWVIIKGKDSRGSGDDFRIEIMQRYSRRSLYFNQPLPGSLVKGVSIKRRWLTYGQSVVTPPGTKLNQGFKYVKGKSIDIATSMSIAIPLIEKWLGIQGSRTISKGLSTQTSFTVTATNPAVPGHRLRAMYFYQLLTVETWYLSLGGRPSQLKATRKKSKSFVTSFGYAVLKEIKRRP
jgi:hypothetical protein